MLRKIKSNIFISPRWKVSEILHVLKYWIQVFGVIGHISQKLVFQIKSSLFVNQRIIFRIFTSLRSANTWSSRCISKLV